jgi:DNA-binding NarL/FixJ family response regulator
MSVTILLADDHPIVRRGLRDLLESAPGFQVVGEAGNGLEAAEMAAALRPRVLVLDLMMPGMNGLELLRQVAHSTPETRAIVLSMHGAQAYVREAIHSGAAGYLLKDAAPVELITAIREALAGRRYLSPALQERLGAEGLEPPGEASADPFNALTARERQVLQLVAEGYTSAGIAGLLSISPRTVELHRVKLMKKLGLKNLAEAVRYAIGRGILPVEP